MFYLFTLKCSTWNSLGMQIRGSHGRCSMKKSIFKYLKTCNFILKRLLHKCFPLNIAKFLRTPILKKICGWLLLANLEKNVLFFTNITRIKGVFRILSNICYDMELFYESSQRLLSVHYLPKSGVINVWQVPICTQGR